jgi:hypothetical protein
MLTAAAAVSSSANLATQFSVKGVKDLQVAYPSLLVLAVLRNLAELARGKARACTERVLYGDPIYNVVVKLAYLFDHKTC